MWGRIYFEWDKVLFRVNRAKNKLQYFTQGIRSKPGWRTIGTIFGLVWALKRKEIKELNKLEAAHVNNFMKWYLRDHAKFKGSFPPFFYPNEIIDIVVDEE